MAFYKILFWQEIPTQVKVYDDFDEVKVELDPKFMVKVDNVAQKNGITNNDDYLAQWNWSEEMEIDGEVDDVVESVKEKVESEYS